MTRPNDAGPSSYQARLHFDSLVHDPAALRLGLLPTLERIGP